MVYHAITLPVPTILKYVQYSMLSTTWFFLVQKENMQSTTPYTYNTELSSLAEFFFVIQQLYRVLISWNMYDVQCSAQVDFLLSQKKTCTHNTLYIQHWIILTGRVFFSDATTLPILNILEYVRCSILSTCDFFFFR